MHPLSQDQAAGARIEIGMKGSPFASCNAVGRPQQLFGIHERYGLVGLLPGMRLGKRDVGERVPVLGRDNTAEMGGEGVDDGDCIIAVRDCQGASAAEIILYINYEEGAVLIKNVLIKNVLIKKMIHVGNSFLFRPIR